jgi:hypothetical protein
MKYRCIPCNHEFEAPKGTKPRCPRCLKIHDVEPIESPGPPKKTSVKTILVPIAVLIVAIVVSIVYALTKNDSTGEAKESAVDSKSVFETAGIPVCGSTGRSSRRSCRRRRETCFPWMRSSSYMT